MGARTPINKGRDGRVSSLPFLKLVGIVRDVMVVIFVIFVNQIQIFNNLIVILIFKKKSVMILKILDSDS